MTSPPEHPDAWYLAALSTELRPGAVLAREVGGREVALFRGASGGVAALSSTCTHLGARLAAGDVVEETLRCPLHHRRYDRSGACVGPEAGGFQPAHPVVETRGGLFVAPGTVAPFPLRLPEGAFRIASGPVVTLRCPWWAVVANGFDVAHFVTVHGRELVEPVEVDAPEPDTLRLRYVARVVGRSASDRLVRRLAADRVRVSIRCVGGPLVVVESEAGRERALLLLGLLPRGGVTEVRPLFGVVPRGPLDPLRGPVSRWLFTRFLARDLSILDGIRFDVGAARTEPVLGSLFEFLGARPALPAPGGRPAPPGSRI